MKFHKEIIPERIDFLVKNVFYVNGVDETINAFENYFKLIKCPVRLSEISTGKEDKIEIVKMMNENKVGGMNLKLKNEDHRKIVDLFW